MLSRSTMSLACFCGLLASDLRALQRPPEACDRYAAAVRADPDNRAAAVTPIFSLSSIARGSDCARCRGDERGQPVYLTSPHS
jgi:hypothetical protein